jgi:putative ATPase
MRPTTLDQFIGQQHLVGQGKILAQMAQSGRLRSMIFWGPPGVGKTTLAMILAQAASANFFTLSAIDSGVKEVRAVIEQARMAGSAVLFIDEIHRFNKAQQDSLLGAVEKGILTLIGATTENPSFEVISALLSRCQVYVLEPLTVDELKQVAIQAIEKDTFLQKRELKIDEWEALLQLSGGDARRMLNLLELTADSLSADDHSITNKKVEDTIHHKAALYDKAGEQHYDIISAFIKSMRGSDPNAALYWLARMIAGGEDPKFIARRMLIFASEDIGNANPNALLLATSTFQAVQMIGWPESRIILAQCVTYLATSIKSNASYMGINQAQALVSQTGDLPVPLHIRNAPTKLMKDLNYGKGYQYAHDFENNFVIQEFLPDEIAGRKLYDPGQSPTEERIRQFLKDRWGEKYGY